MLRNIVVLSLVLIVSAGSVQRAFSQEDIERTLTRAQALYYEARFKDSIDLLLPIDATLRQQPNRVSQSISVKLQLALAYIGQNQIAAAKSVFQEVFVLDANYALDASQFAPKVLTLFDEARAEQKKATCAAFCVSVDRLSKNADADGLLRLAQAGDGCACSAVADAAELLYKQGVDAYKRDDFTQALRKLRAAVKFRPQHDLAVQYVELAESKVKVTVDRLVLDWRKNFEAQEFPRAATLYQQLESSNVDGKADAALEQMRGEYRKVAYAKLESWNQTCGSSGSPPLDTYRQQMKDLLPNEAIVPDLALRFPSCESKVPETSVSTAAAPGCIQMASQVAMARLKSRVNPDIQLSRLPIQPLNLRAKVRIDEYGNVAVQDIQGSNRYINETMKAAIEKWKFIPATIGEQKRCVETELPIVLGRN
jgi:tetratricopeptide (TPR) repeat protein